MKTLIIFFVLLGIVFFYFVANTEKSVTLMNDEVTPVGGRKLSETISGAISGLRTVNDSGSETGAGAAPIVNQVINKTKELAGKAIDKAENLIKNPIENKINEIFCPQK